MVSFRFNAKKVGLTYSCPRSGPCAALPTGEHATDCECANPIEAHADVLRAMHEKFGRSKYIIGKEQHVNGAVHWHAFFHFDEKIDSQDVRCFDIEGVHPNIIRAPGAGWQSYCKKEKEFTSNMDDNPYMKAMGLSTAQEAIDYLWETVPDQMCKHAHNIEANIRKRKRTPPEPKIWLGPYPKDYYPEKWDPTSHSLLLYGPPEKHKTQFARYLLAHTCGEHDFVKRGVEQLKTIPLDKPFVFDEIYLSDPKTSPWDSREITDVENGGTINARYGDIAIPPGIPRIFTSNYEHPFKNPQESVYKRRVVSHAIRVEPKPAVYDPQFA